jgi:hypothetical protein
VTGSPFELPDNPDDFNPLREFYVMFDVAIQQKGTRERIALLSRVWNAPALPQPGDYVYIGNGRNQLILKLDRRRRAATAWYDDRVITLEATLLHVQSPRELLDKVRALMEDNPGLRTQLHARLHIYPAMELASQTIS